MALGYEAWREARRTLQVLLSANEGTLRDDVSLQSRSVCVDSAQVVHTRLYHHQAAAFQSYALACEVTATFSFFALKQYVLLYRLQEAFGLGPLFHNQHTIKVLTQMFKFQMSRVMSHTHI